MYHAACKVEFQPFTVVLTADVFQLFIKLFTTIPYLVLIIRTRRMYHAACKVEFQPFTVVLTADVFQLFIKLFIAILLFVVVKQYEVRSRRQLALSSAIPQGKHNHAWCMF